MDISKFKANIKDIAIKNRFLLYVEDNKYFNNVRNMYQFLASSLEIPSTTIKDTNTNFWGQELSIGSSLDLDLFNITFYCDAKMLMYDAMVKWRKDIVNEDTLLVNYFNNYAKDIKVQAHNKKNESVYEWNFLKAHPKTISPMTYAYDDDSIATFTVSFKYQKSKEGLVTTAKNYTTMLESTRFEDPYLQSTLTR